MDFFTRASNGWNIAKNSFKVLEENKQLVIFPLISGASLFLIIASFATAFMSGANWDFDQVNDTATLTTYALVFLYYLVNYFVIVFFNTALTYCTGSYFKGEAVSIKKGMAFSISHITIIFSWAVFAATIGTILKIIQENTGIIGKFLTGFVGAVFSIATYFVVPVITFEHLGPVAALNRSAQMMKANWGERVGAGFNFFVVQFIAMVFIAIVAITVGTFFNAIAGGIVALLSILLMIAVLSAVKSIFASAVYHNITGDPVEHFNQQFVDKLFVEK